MYEFKFPDVGEGITEGTLVKWLVKEGEEIKKEQTVAEVETDKAVVEIPSPVSGTVMKLLAEPHQILIVGKPFILIDDGTTGFNAPDQFINKSNIHEKPKEVKEPTAVPPPLEKPYTPQVQPTTIQQPALQPPRSAIVLALPSVRKAAKEKNIDLHMLRGSGKDNRIVLSDVENYSGQQISLQYLQTEIKTTPQPKQTIIAPITDIIHHDRMNQKEILATPSIRQLARDLNIDIYAIKGTGHDGSVTREDVENAGKTSASQLSATNAQTISIQPAPTGGDETIPLTAIRKTIAKKMSESWHNAVHVMVSDEADVTEIVAIQQKNAEAYKQHGIKLTFLPFFVNAAVLALQKNPKLNAMLDEQNNRIIQKHYYNMGIAVDTEAGLMVPVIKNAEKMNIPQIAAAINDLATRARNKQLKPEEMSGGTFTITNIGSIAGQMFTQIINYPEAAILGIGRIVDKPVVKDNQLQIRKIVVLSATADHRIIDGADVARFLKTLISYMESPDNIFMEMML